MGLFYGEQGCVSGESLVRCTGDDGLAQGDERYTGLNAFQKSLFKAFRSGALTVEQGANTQVFLAAAADSKGDLTKNGGKDLWDGASKHISESQIKIDSKPSSLEIRLQ